MLRCLKYHSENTRLGGNMTLPYIPTVLILGALFGLVGSGLIFRITHNIKATVWIFIAVFAFAAFYAVMYMVQSNIVFR